MSLVAVGACYVDTILTLVGNSSPAAPDNQHQLTINAERLTTRAKMRSCVLQVSLIAAEETVRIPWRCCSN
jgi:hypothetical protein